MRVSAGAGRDGRICKPIGSGGGSRPVVDAIPPRPPGMGRKTYVRLCARVERLERALIDSLVLRYAPRWIEPLASYWI